MKNIPQQTHTHTHTHTLEKQKQRFFGARDWTNKKHNAERDTQQQVNR